MSETSPGIPQPKENNEEQRKKEFFALAKELSERPEGFPFPGLNPDEYDQKKAEREEFAGFVTPLDELLKKMQQEGIKIVLGDDPVHGNIVVLPLGSNNVFEDSLLLNNLDTNDSMDVKLKRLIEIRKEGLFE